MDTDMESTLATQFMKRLEEMYADLQGYADLAESIGLIMKDSRLREILRHAEEETAGRNYINKHGTMHAFRVASNVLDLFRLIDEEVVQSDYVTDFPLSKVTKTDILFTLIVSAYIHDCGRFYDAKIDHESQISDALEILRQLADQALRNTTPIAKDAILRFVKELFLLHDKKKEGSGKVEIALLKLADALDCSKERTYQKPQWLTPKQKVIDVFRKDKFPEEYFGTYAVQSVKLNWIEGDGIVQATVSISDYAASLPVSRILQVLSGCKGRASLQEFADSIRIDLEDATGQKVILHPEYRKSFPRCQLIETRYELDLDDEGSGKVDVMLRLKNCGRREQKRLTCQFWGLQDREIAWGKDAKVKMWVAGHGNAEKELEIQYEGSGDEPMSHTWAAILPEPLRPQQSVQIRGEYLWKRLANPAGDSFDFEPGAPTESHQVTILLPMGVDAGELLWSARITDMDKKTILVSPSMIEAKQERPRLKLRAEFQKLQPGYTYSVTWGKKTT